MYKIYNDSDQLVAQSNQEVDESILELLECLNYRIECIKETNFLDIYDWE